MDSREFFHRVAMVMNRCALFCLLATVMACAPVSDGNAFEWGPHDPLGQLERIPATPAGSLFDMAPSTEVCTDEKKSAYRLLDVVERALCNNPKVRSAWANVKGQAAQVGVAKAAYLPTLSASLQRAKDHSVSQGTGSNPFDVQSGSQYTNDTLTLNWLLYDFGARSAATESAEKTLVFALASQDNALQTVFANTVKDYYTALVAQKNVQSTADIETAAKRILDAAVMRVRGGVAAISDQLQAQTAYSQAVYNRIKAEGDWRTALGMLAMDMGNRPDIPIALLEPEGADLPDTAFSQSVEELLQTAQARHPALIAARADLDAAQANEKNVRAQGRPSISFVARQNYNTQPQSAGLGLQSVGATGRDRYIAIQVDIPLFEGFSRTYKIRNVQAQVESKAAGLADTELQVALGVWSNYQSLKVSTENVRISQQILESAQLAFQSAESRYQKGVADMIELITTQNTLATARQQQIQAVAGWQNARLQLAFSLGALSLSSLQ